MVAAAVQVPGLWLPRCAPRDTSRAEGCKDAVRLEGKGRGLMPTLVLLRHGQSQWNLENRFTGWWDVDLSPAGEEEARAAGRLLKASGVEFTRCYASVQ